MQMSQFFIIFKCGYLKHKPNANRSSASSGIDVTEGAGTVCWALTAREPQHIDLNDVKIPDIRCPTNFRETGRVFHAGVTGVHAATEKSSAGTSALFSSLCLGMLSTNVSCYVKKFL